MIQSLQTSVSGMFAAQTRQDVVGHNLANVNTAGYGPDRVGQTEEPNQNGVRVSEIRKTPAADPRYSGTEISTEMVGMIVAEKSFGFNAAAIKTQDQMLGELMDLKA